MNATEAQRQREQLAKYTAWVKVEGNMELPTRLDTLMLPHQIARLNWLKKYATGQIMELGCSWGYALAYVGGHIGVDANEHLIALARLLNPAKEFVVADIRTLPFKDNSVDTIIIPDVLEHLPWEVFFSVVDKARAIARMRVLITLPYEMAGLEGQSFKHQWLVTTAKLAKIQRMYGDSIITKKRGFVLIAIKAHGRE